MTNDSRRFGFTYGYDDAVTAAMQERTYQWMDIVFVDFGEISGDCLLRTGCMGRKLESHAAVFCCGACCLWSHNAGECVFSEYRKI